MFEEMIQSLQDAIGELQAAHSSKTTMLEYKHDAETVVEEFKAVAQLQGIGTKKEHGSNDKARKAYLDNWLSSNPSYVAAVADINMAERELIEHQEVIAFRTKQIMAIQAQADLYAIIHNAKETSKQAPVAGL